MNWTATALTERFGIRYPLIQAPMAGGPGTPRLVAAVSNAGGLGSLAGGSLRPEALRQAIAAVRALTAQPFVVNLAVMASAPVDLERIAHAREVLAPYRKQLGLAPALAARLEPPVFEEQLDVLLQERVPAVSFTFGVPDTVYLELLRDAGIVILGAATHLLEAIVLEESGVDFIIAQGAEAGGHRATFIGSPEQGLVGSLTLTPLLNRYITTPVIAAGGVMDGRGIAAMRVLGAVGVQMGTAFLCCPESGAHPAYQALLSQGSEIATTLSRVFSGRAARVLRNRLTEELQAHEALFPGFPVQLLLTEELRQTAESQGVTDFMALWAGQGCHLCETRPAAELIAAWVKQANALLGTTPVSPSPALRTMPTAASALAPDQNAEPVSASASVSTPEPESESESIPESESESIPESESESPAAGVDLSDIELNAEIDRYLNTEPDPETERYLQERYLHTMLALETEQSLDTGSDFSTTEDPETDWESVASVTVKPVHEAASVAESDSQSAAAPLAESTLPVASSVPALASVPPSQHPATK